MNNSKYGTGSHEPDGITAVWESFGIPPPLREYYFDPEARSRFDYAWPEAMVAVELEGGIFRRGLRGAHVGPTAVLRDITKGNRALELGWQVVRVVPNNVAIGFRETSTRTIDLIKFLLAAAGDRSPARKIRNGGIDFRGRSADNNLGDGATRRGKK